MKKIGLILCFLLSYTFTQAQESYTVDGETLQLKTEVDGKLDLLWNIIDGKYRYFLRNSNGTITELKNTKDSNNDYQEEYKTVLQNATEGSNLSTKKLNLTLFSLKEFIDNYNQKSDTTYQTQVSRNGVTFRLGAFGGITNSPFVGNPENLKTPLFGAELEVLETKNLTRHAVFMQLKHVLEHDDLQYSTTELSLGYRFRFINKQSFSLYGNMKFATLNFSNATVTTTSGGNTTTQEFNETAFDVPFIFGIGADIRVTENSFITLGYNELFALLLDNQGNFSTNITIGYKFNL